MLFSEASMGSSLESESASADKLLHRTTLISSISLRCISSRSRLFIIPLATLLVLLVEFTTAALQVSAALSDANPRGPCIECTQVVVEPHQPLIGSHSQLFVETKEQPQLNQPISQIGASQGPWRTRRRRSASAELRVSGSMSEPPSRPSVDWSKQRPYFGSDMQRNVSVELGKTAYLTCKVYELGDKIVSWLRPRGNEILTSGRYTYISDSRFASINDPGSHDWILEIKDVGLNDSTSYECQVSTDPKISSSVNLNVKAAKARIKQGTEYHAPLGSDIEFTCEISQRFHPSPPNLQTYWYYNGNLLNYAKTNPTAKNFSIESDSISQTSRFRLFDVQLNDSGNYSCRPTSAEPATINLHVKNRYHKLDSKHRAYSSSSSSKYHASKDADRLQDSSDKNSASSLINHSSLILKLIPIIIVVCLTLL